MFNENLVATIEKEIKETAARKDINSTEIFETNHPKELFVRLAHDNSIKLYRVTTGYDYIASNGFRGTFITDYYMVACGEKELKDKWSKGFKLPIISLHEAECWETEEVLIKHPDIYQIT